MAFDWGSFVSEGLDAYMGQREQKQAKREREKESNRQWYTDMAQQDRSYRDELNQAMLKALQLGGQAGIDYIESIRAMRGDHPIMDATKKAMERQAGERQGTMGNLLELFGQPKTAAAGYAGMEPEVMARVLAQAEALRQRGLRSVPGGNTVFDTRAGQPMYTAPKQYAPRRQRAVSRRATGARTTPGPVPLAPAGVPTAAAPPAVNTPGIAARMDKLKADAQDAIRRGAPAGQVQQALANRVRQIMGGQ